MRSTTGRRAFTLTEVIIVVLIIGILAAILIPSYANASGAAAVSATAVDLREFQRATGLYAIEVKGDLPTTNEEYRLGIAPYLEPDATLRKPPIGGAFGFHVWGATDMAAIGIWGPERPDLGAEIDAQVDDGNLSTGAMRSAASTGLLFVVYGDASAFIWP